MIQFSIPLPGKTFLLGEYVVLDGGPGLILTTPPYFEMRFSENHQTTSMPQKIFPAQSPAARWIEKNADFFKKYQMDFFDPHEGQGGFGASGAEFISVYAAQHPIETTIPWIENLLAAYFSVQSEDAVVPSGADLVAQVCGYDQGIGASMKSGNMESQKAETITYWHRAEKKLDVFTWPFADLSYCLIRTGYKHATHQGLKKLPAHALTEMTQVVQQGYKAFVSKDTSAFVHAIKEYAGWMSGVGCVLGSTQDLLQLLYRSKLIKAAKGCGALGADVVLVLLATEKLTAFLAWLEEGGIASVGVGVSFCGSVRPVLGANAIHGRHVPKN